MREACEMNAPSQELGRMSLKQSFQCPTDVDVRSRRCFFKSWEPRGGAEHDYMCCGVCSWYAGNLPTSVKRVSFQQMFSTIQRAWREKAFLPFESNPRAQCCNASSRSLNVSQWLSECLSRTKHRISSQTTASSTGADVLGLANSQKLRPFALWSKEWQKMHQNWDEENHHHDLGEVVDQHTCFFF